MASQKRVTLDFTLGLIWPPLWFIVKDCQMIKKFDNYFPGGKCHLKAEQTIPQFRTTA